MASEKQKSAQEKFKKKVEEAKAIKKKHPEKKYSECLKMAWKK